MSCTNPTVLRRRRILAAALAVPLSLGMVSTAYATGPADEPRGSAETASLRVASADKELPTQAAAAQAEKAAAEKAELRVAAAGPAEQANEKATEKATEKAESKAEPAHGPAEKAAENQAAVEEKKADTSAAPGAAAGAASGKSAAAATTTNAGYVNGNANSSKAERPNAPVPGTPSQPLSNADKNGTGANPGETCTHAYCSNGTGLETGNGKGDGKAVGQPCAGCVGKADNKNPKGQAPNGSDHNAGYECDRNQGIGKTNPAHTGCTTTTTPPTTPPGDNNGGGNNGGGNNGGGNGGDDKLGFCHATGSSTNPYVLLETSKAAAANGHHGVDHQGGRDIIPAFTYKGVTYPAQGNQALLGTGCETGGNNGGGGNGGEDKLGFCHATGSSTNPYVLLETSKAAAANGHYGVDHQGGRDIIPAFTYKGVTYPAQGNQARLGTGCVQGGTTVDVCPDMDGDQPAGTPCTIGGGGGGGGSFDNCPDMPGNQPANFVCTVGSPDPTPPTETPTPIEGQPEPQPATNPVPVGPPTQIPPVIVPNAAVPPAVIGGTTVLPVNRPLSARAVPSALPFTGGEVAMIVQLGLLLVAAGVGVGAVARRERTAV